MNLANEELITQYLEGQLSPEVQSALEQRLEQEPALAEALEEELRARAVVAVSAREARKAELKARYTASGQGGKVRSLWTWSAVAVAVAAAVLVLFMIRMPDSGEASSPEALFAAYYEQPAFSGSRAGQSPDAWSEASNAYQNGDFAQCAQTLGGMLADSSFQEPNKAWFYAGLCFLELSEYSQALESLSKVAEGSAFYPQAEWFAALASMKAGRLSEAGSALKIIAGQPRHPFREKADALLEALP